MYKIILTCNVITPMFMAGADGKTPELRPSEFKGMMRFWWRAIKAESNIDNLRKEEAEIFGGTGEKEGKSKVKIRVIPENIQRDSYRRLPHSSSKIFRLDCFKNDSTFKIFLETYINIEFFSNLLTISTILGGFGKGARRGFGSIEIFQPEELNFGNLGREEYLEKILEILNQIDNHYKIQNSKIVNTKSGGNYPWIKEIEIGKNYLDWEELLKKIGDASHKHKDPSLGNASPRMASPIYVSVIKIKNMYYPIVTTLESSFPTNYNFNLKKQDDFKREVLS